MLCLERVVVFNSNELTLDRTNQAFIVHVAAA
jgi:hypothetical protein